jgi:hypothetical protein
VSQGLERANQFIFHMSGEKRFNLKAEVCVELNPICRCAVDPYHHSLSWFGDNPRVIDFLADFFFNAFADSESWVACRGMI